MDDKQTDGEKINVSIGGTAAPVAPPPEPQAPPAPTPAPAPVPGLEEEPALPSTDAAPAPPPPGSVVTSSDGTIGGPPQPPQAVVSGGHGGGKKRGLKILIIIIILALLAAGGWYAYNKYIKKGPVSKPVVANKDIPQLKIGLLQADFGDLYPKSSLNEYNYIINTQMFEGLVRYEDKSKIVPNLASTWSNPDDKTWLFTIKDGIKFHDGHTLAASDVKYSLDQMISDSKSDFSPDICQHY